MFANQNAALDDEDDVTAMTIVFLLMKLTCGYKMKFLWMISESLCVFFAFNCFCSIIESVAHEMCCDMI